MTDLARKTAVEFGSTAGTDEIAKFGSLAAGSPVFSTDPAVIQALAQFTGGWFDAVIGGNSPAIEDMNALFFVAFYQIAYTLQKGVPVWDSGTTYYIGNVVSDASGDLYYSLTNTNLNNAVTNTTNWRSLLTSGLLTKGWSDSQTIVSGTSRQENVATIASGKTWTVDSGGALVTIGTLTTTGTLVLNGNWFAY